MKHTYRDVAFYSSPARLGPKFIAYREGKSPQFCFGGDTDEDVIAKAQRAIDFWVDVRERK